MILNWEGVFFFGIIFSLIGFIIYVQVFDFDNPRLNRDKPFWWQPQFWGEEGERLKNFFYVDQTHETVFSSYLGITFFVCLFHLPVYSAFVLLNGIWWLSLIMTVLFSMGICKLHRWFWCDFIKYREDYSSFEEFDKATWLKQPSDERRRFLESDEYQEFKYQERLSKRKRYERKLSDLRKRANIKERIREYAHNKKQYKEDIKQYEENAPKRKLEEEFRANYLHEMKREETPENLERDLKPEEEWRAASNRWAIDVAELILKDWYWIDEEPVEQELVREFRIGTIGNFRGREIERFRLDSTTEELHLVSQNGFAVDENWVGGWQTSRKFPPFEVWAENKKIWDLGLELKLCEIHSMFPISFGGTWPILDALAELTEEFDNGHIDEQTYLQRYRETLRNG